MNAKPFLLPLAAALALHAAPALAQQDHAAHQQKAESSTAKAGIAEGTVKNGVRTVEMQVTQDGFVPAKIKALKGEKLRLVVTRKTDITCAKEIVVQEAGINTPLPLDKAVTVEFTPKKSGELKYACGMGHISGIVFIP
jgi:plastocyanin domain-containing protein